MIVRLHDIDYLTLISEWQVHAGEFVGLWSDSSINALVHKDPMYSLASLEPYALVPAQPSSAPVSLFVPSLPTDTFSNPTHLPPSSRGVTKITGAQRSTAHLLIFKW